MLNEVKHPAHKYCGGKPGYFIKLRRESVGIAADAKKNKKLDRLVRRSSDRAKCGRHIVNISRTNFLLFHSRCGYSGARSRMFDEISGLDFGEFDEF